MGSPKRRGRSWRVRLDESTVLDVWTKRIAVRAATWVTGLVMLFAAGIFASIAVADEPPASIGTAATGTATAETTGSASTDTTGTTTTGLTTTDTTGTTTTGPSSTDTT